MQESDVDKAWLACLIDCEGNLYWARKNAGRYFYVSVGITNTNRDILLRALEIVGYGNIYCRSNNTGFGTKPVFALQYTGRQAVIILKNIVSFMIVKRDKARELLFLDGKQVRRIFTK